MFRLKEWTCFQKKSITSGKVYVTSPEPMWESFTQLYHVYVNTTLYVKFVTKSQGNDICLYKMQIFQTMANLSLDDSTLAVKFLQFNCIFSFTFLNSKHVSQWSSPTCYILSSSVMTSLHCNDFWFEVLFCCFV